MFGAPRDHKYTIVSQWMARLLPSRHHPKLRRGRLLSTATLCANPYCTIHRAIIWRNSASRKGLLR
jgi:hypothetical protein